MDKEQIKALLTGLGITITDEQADTILAGFNKSLDNNYVTKARFDEVNEKNKTLTTQLSERDASITQLKKDIEDKPSKEKVDELEKKLADKDKEYALQLAENTKKIRIISEIAGKVHDNDLVIGQLNLDKITVDGDNGPIIGLNEQLEALKKSKGFLFKDEKPLPGDGNATPNGTPNTNNGMNVPEGNNNANPAANVKSPNVGQQPGGNVDPEDKVTKQRDAIIQKMLAKQKLNQSKREGEE